MFQIHSWSGSDRLEQSFNIKGFTHGTSHKELCQAVPISLFLNEQHCDWTDDCSFSINHCLSTVCLSLCVCVVCVVCVV